MKILFRIKIQSTVPTFDFQYSLGKILAESTAESMYTAWVLTDISSRNMM